MNTAGVRTDWRVIQGRVPDLEHFHQMPLWLVEPIPSWTDRL